MKNLLIETIRNEFPEFNEKDSEILVNFFYEESEIELNGSETEDLIFYNSSKEEAKSYKFKNIKFNLKKLIVDSSEITLSISGAKAIPELWPFVAIIILNKLFSNIELVLEKRHANVMKLMWENFDTKTKLIEEKIVFKLYNDFLKENDQPIISKKDFLKILSDLEKFKCIKSKGNSEWLLKEKVVVYGKLKKS